MGLKPESVRLFTLSNMNIFTTRRLIPIKFCLKHNLGEGKSVFGFGPDQMGTLVSMATDSSHQTWGKLIVNANALIMHSFFPVIQGND